MIIEADRMQRLIAGYMARVHNELEMVPHVRIAATAYTRGEGTL